MTSLSYGAVGQKKSRLRLWGIGFKVTPASSGKGACDKKLNRAGEEGFGVALSARAGKKEGH